jgi:tetratricopeptide (TPR) repeat protein
MTDGVFPDRLTQLRARWESDPASRIFLQLAEEYRHLGRIQDALAVLDKGLKEHPGYLSALVAKGRCHIELAEGEEARVVLERVVKQDATQMVANKLLVRAYLETGDPVKARERLDLYSLLNDSDPEIEELRRRIRQLEKPVQPETPSMDADPFSLPPPAPRPAEVFDLAPPAPPRRGGDDIFELEAAPPPPAPVRAEEPFAPPPPPVPEPEEEPAAEAGALFPGLASRDNRRRYLDALGAEGLFSFEAPPAPFAPPPPISLTAEPFAPALSPAELYAPEPFEPEPFVPEPPAVEEPEEVAVEEATWLDEAAESVPAAPAPVLEPLMPAIFAPAPPESAFAAEHVAEDLWHVEAAPLDPGPPPVPVFDPEPEPEPEPAPEPEPEVATATLGDLYFRQGHYAEAERLFREVLHREPANVSALAGLARLAALGPQPATPRLDARRLLAGYRRDVSQPADVEVRSRKTFVLSRYLERLRLARPSDVS